MNHNERQAWVTVLDRDDTGPPAYLYDLSPIGESRIARYIPAMTKPFTLLTSAASLFAFLILAPTAPAQNPAAEEKAIALAQQLKLMPQQEVEVLPILKAEAPKFEAIKNDPSFSLWMAWSCFIFCIPESEGSFLIASNFGASALRIGRTSTSCCGVSFSCCAKAITFASASGFWAGAAGARIRKARRQATDVRSVKSFLMFALCLFTAQLAYGT